MSNPVSNAAYNKQKDHNKISPAMLMIYYLLLHKGMLQSADIQLELRSKGIKWKDNTINARIFDAYQRGMIRRVKPTRDLDRGYLYFANPHFEPR